MAIFGSWHRDNYIWPSRVKKMFFKRKYICCLTFCLSLNPGQDRLQKKKSQRTQDFESPDRQVGSGLENSFFKLLDWCLTKKNMDWWTCNPGKARWSSASLWRQAGSWEYVCTTIGVSPSRGQGCSAFQQRRVHNPVVFFLFDLCSLAWMDTFDPHDVFDG